jgi:hypothetical protein
MPNSPLDPRAIEGIQLRVLAHIFPVLRHDALKPLSNAKLTLVLLQKAIEKGTLAPGDPPPLLGDLDNMLDDSVAAVRLLSNWYQDDNPPLPIDAVVQECRRLAFPQLLLSGKKLQIDDFEHATPIEYRTSRYVLMAWLLQAIHALPQRGVLHIRQEGPKALAACSLPAPPDAPERTIPPENQPPISQDDMHAIARFYGWSVSKQNDGWLLDLP